MALTKKQFYRQLQQLDHLILLNNQQLRADKSPSRQSYNQMLVSAVLPNKSVEDRLLYLEKYLELMRQACGVAFNNDNKSGNAANNRLGWPYFSTTQAVWADDKSGSGRPSINVMLEDIHRNLPVLQASIITLLNNTSGIFANKEKRA